MTPSMAGAVLLVNPVRYSMLSAETIVKCARPADLAFLHDIVGLRIVQDTYLPLTTMVTTRRRRTWWSTKWCKKKWSERKVEVDVLGWLTDTGFGMRRPVYLGTKIYGLKNGVEASK